jgi:hypothetical protein
MVIGASLPQLDIDVQATCGENIVMSKKWIPRMASVTEWLRAPQPRSGEHGYGDADRRRTHHDLDAIRARFQDHA